MSLARAFTTRRSRPALDGKDSASGSSDGFLNRSKTTKALAVHGSIRNKISGPVELTHTTNMLSYTSPDIFPGRAHTPAATPPSTSSKSDDESDSGYTAASTPPTSPDTPYADKQLASPEPNHLSCYFMPPKPAVLEQTGAAGPVHANNTAAFPASDAPAIPQRAPSHTKKSYDGLARHRSVSRMSEQSARTLSSKASFSFSRSSSSSTSTSVTSMSHASPTSAAKPSYHHGPSASVSASASASLSAASAKPAMPLMSSAPAPPPVSHKKEYSETHPFGHELAKVSELVEEFGKEDAVATEPVTMAHAKTGLSALFAEEEHDLARRGLKKYSAESYISDIQSLMTTFFGDTHPAPALWI